MVDKTSAANGDHIISASLPNPEISLVDNKPLLMTNLTPFSQMKYWSSSRTTVR